MNYNLRDIGMDVDLISAISQFKSEACARENVLKERSKLRFFTTEKNEPTVVVYTQHTHGRIRRTQHNTRVVWCVVYKI